MISHATARAILEAVRKHVTARQMENILNEIEKIDGNRSFRESIKLMREMEKKK